MPVVRTDGRAYGHVITKFSQMGRLPHFLTHGAPLRARELRYKSRKISLFTIIHYNNNQNDNTQGIIRRFSNLIFRKKGPATRRVCFSAPMPQGPLK